ncbi:MAG: ATP-binding protein [Candidatus Aenigmatarchaeota archaeon]
MSDEKIKVAFFDDEERYRNLADELLGDNFDIDVFPLSEAEIDDVLDRDYSTVVSEYDASGDEERGLALYEEIINRRIDVPFIIYTGQGNEEKVMKALNKGVDYYVKKKDDYGKSFGRLKEGILSKVFEKNMKDKEEEDEKFVYSLLRHDLKNKAQIIDGWIQMALDDDLPEETEEKLRKSRKAVRQCLKLADKAGSLGEIKKERIEKVHLPDYLQEAVSYGRNLNGEVTVKDDWRRKWREDDSGNFVLAGDLLSEAFENIVENSVKHSGADELVVGYEDLDDEYRIYFEDDGEGIPEEIKDRLFEKDIKGKESSGTGMGTYITKRIVEVYGGRVKTVEGESGGTRFDVYLEKAEEAN